MDWKDKEKGIKYLNSIQRDIENQTAGYRTAVKIIQEQTEKYNQVIQPVTKSIEIFQNAIKPYSSIDYKGATAILNSTSEIMKKWQDFTHFTITESFGKAFERTDYLTTINILNNNIEAIKSAMNAINRNEIESVIQNLKEVDNSVMQNSDRSIAEMSAEINDEDYEKPKINYNEFNLLIKTISFIDDPVKSAEILNELLFIADHCVDYNFKILIYQKITEEVAGLIAGGFITIVVFLLGFVLKILLRDTIIHKQYFELKDSIKNYKNSN